MDKQALVDQLTEKLRSQLRVARRAGGDAREAAREMATEQEKKEDSRQALEFGSLATGHDRRLRQLAEELAALELVRPRPLAKRDPITIGAIVEIEDEENGEGRTFFVLPVGAGQELTGPGGDGLLTVVTTHSPIGRAVMGKRQDDSVQVVTHGEPRDWLITYVE